jgi:hypothetical protein
MASPANMPIRSQPDSPACLPEGPAPRGAAADAFRQRFHGHTQRFTDAAACFQEAAAALERYVPALEWAQQQAGAFLSEDAR